MSPSPIPLTPVRSFPSAPDYQALLTWPFPPQPFYAAQVKKLLETDIPHRATFGLCAIWTYRDPDGNTVGFGTLDLCNDHETLSGGKRHWYIPVLGVHPAFERRGHGRSIVSHLIETSVVLTHGVPDLSEFLFLDVYAANASAIRLYEKCGFQVLNPDNPTQDPDENNEPYLVMARRIIIAPS